MKVVKVSKILKDLKRDGWYIARIRGSHREFKHPIKKGITTVNGKESEDIMGFLLKSIDFYLEGRREDGEKYSPVVDGEYEVIYDFDIPTLLDYYRGIFSFSALQSITGIHQKQLAHYASDVSYPRPKQAAKIKEGLRKLAKDIEMVTCCL